MNNPMRKVKPMHGEKIELFLREYDASLGAVKHVAGFFYEFLGDVFPRTSFEWLRRRGIIHTSIEIKCGNFAVEFHFGRDGIVYSEPGKSYFGNKPAEITNLGRTELSWEQLCDLLDNLEKGKFKKGTYSLTDHNCNNFTDQFSKNTVGKGISKDIVNAPKTVTEAVFLTASKVATAIGLPRLLSFLIPGVSWLKWLYPLFETTRALCSY